MFKTPQEQYIYETELEVRDYEIDAEGIVNNANYLHYLEHTRHCFCRDAGMSFDDMRHRGIDPVLSKVTISYMTPLRSGDRFKSCLAMTRKGPRFIFQQDIYRVDGTPVVKAEVVVAALKDGKLSRGEELAEAFSKYLV